MRIVRPAAITDAVLTDSNILENDYPVWAAGTTYAADQYVILTSTHRIYRSVQGGNVGHNPALADPAWWQDVGATNKWVAFDGSIQSQAVKLNTMYFEFTLTGRVDTLAFLNASFNQARVEVSTTADGVVFDKTYGMVATSGINNWYAYLFEDIRRLSDKTILELPSYLNPKVKVTLTNPSGNVKVGAIILGRQKYIGRTQYGSSVGITDFSKKDQDQFGNYVIVERPYKKKGSFNVMVDNTLIDELQVLLASYRATPILYLGTDVFESTSVYGFYKDFSLVIQYPTESQFNLEVEGLT